MPDTTLPDPTAAAYRIVSEDLREAVPLSLLQPQQAVSDQIVERLADAGLVTNLSATAVVVLDILRQSRPENAMSADAISQRIVSTLRKNDILVTGTPLDGMTPAEAEVWEKLRSAASAALALIDGDCQHTMEKSEVCTMFHGLQRWVAARPFQRQLLGLDGGPGDPRGT